MKEFPTREQVERMKNQYPKGTIIELMEDLEDSYAPIAKGVRGEVIGVDDMGTLHMKWQNGRSLGIIPSEDSFKVISRPETQEVDTLDMEIWGMKL